MMTERSSRLDAWTLTEVLVSMGIVLVLSGSVGIASSAYVERARHLGARLQISTFHIALDTYFRDTGAYPSEAQGLEALVEPPTLAPLPTDWRGPYLAAGIPLDPWGQPYRYATHPDDTRRRPVVHYGSQE